MRTRWLNADEVAQAAEIIRAGGVVVFPTETVYGLGANAFDPAACRHIFSAKRRPAANPLIVHVSGIDMLQRVVTEVPPSAAALLQAFAPGPLTLVLPAQEAIADVVTAGQSTVAVRWPAHPLARRLIAAADLPIAAPSANRSGRPSPTDATMARREMQGRVDAVIDGGPCRHGVESTIVEPAIVEPAIVGATAVGATTVGAQTNQVRLLREGVITREMLAGVVELLEPSARPQRAAPGSAYSHYRPNARVVAVDRGRLAETLLRYRNERAGVICLARTQIHSLPKSIVACSVATVIEYARELYRFFHTCEAAGCAVIVAEMPPAAGLGRTVRDRLLRAATQQPAEQQPAN